MMASRIFALAGRLPQGGFKAASSLWQCRFAWTEADEQLKFRVKADGANLQKLAGGISLRCEQRLHTVLEAMGDQSIYNSIKALVLVNRFAAKRRVESDTDPNVKAPWFQSVGFVPLFGRSKNGREQWMRLTVVGLPEQQGLRASETPLESSLLKVSSKTPTSALQNSILNEWLQRCAGRTSEPVLAAMGPASVTTAVKGAAFCLLELRRRKGASIPFCCHPDIRQETQSDGRTITLTYISLEPQPQAVAVETEQQND
eukprot:TRINITY_DN82788_c0_g1_i1.p1 TRINITY_DN82788_c0_g1~~TRINITY_DN82788_c0_g1_i1.p1  ORF type:complete len:258 (-),score=47.82 TRINITY_DN82788_c0_g1_i1:438-1211(-)